MDRVVDLHGGPWHGRRVAIPPKAVRLHITAPFEKPGNFTVAEAVGESKVTPKREGTYSQVRGTQNDFEWDGWRPEE